MIIMLLTVLSTDDLKYKNKAYLMCAEMRHHEFSKCTPPLCRIHVSSEEKREAEEVAMTERAESTPQAK
jgi:hypothetical protein